MIQIYRVVYPDTPRNLHVSIVVVICRVPGYIYKPDFVMTAKKRLVMILNTNKASPIFLQQT